MTEPTDAEIVAVMRDGYNCRYNDEQDHIDFARAVLAKWGTPPAVGEPVAWQQGSLTTVNQDPYPSLGDWFVQFWEGDDVAARVYGNDMETLRRRCAVISTPQPTQAQAGAVPLTNARLQEISLNYSDSEDECTGFRDGWRAAEKHYGIKGGQHGPS